MEGTVDARSLHTLQESATNLIEFAGFQVYADIEVPMSLPWSLAAQSLTVNLTHRQWKAWVQSPGNPDEMLVGGPKNLTYEEFDLELASVDGDTGYYKSNLLIEPASTHGNATLALAGATDWQAGTDDLWWGGFHYPGWQTAGENPLVHFYSPPTGIPVGSSNALGMSRIQGDFTVYVWGSNFTLDSIGHASQRYRSGIWTQDELVAPTGLVLQRATHAQLVRLEAHNASLDLQVQGGNTRWASRQASLATEGYLSFDDAIVDMQSFDNVYRAAQASVTITGTINANLRSSATEGTLLAEVEARNAALSMLPTAARPVLPISTHEMEGASRTGSDGAPHAQAPDLAPTNHAPLWIVAFAVAGFSGVFLLSRRVRARTEAERLLHRAERALVAGDVLSCDQLVDQALQFEPRNGHAWFLAGASLLKQGQHDRAARLLTDILERIEKEAAGLAYLLSLSLHRAGRADEAKRWLGLVARDAKLWESLGQETDFDLVLRRILAGPRADAAYS